MSTFPLCFTSLELYELWRSTRVSATAKTECVCVDCLPSYQLRMKKTGRCEHPETMFTIDEVEGIVWQRKPA